MRAQANLDSDDFDPAWVPLLPLPAIYAHRAEAEEADGAIAFTHLNAVDHLFRGGCQRLCEKR